MWKDEHIIGTNVRVFLITAITGDDYKLHQCCAAYMSDYLLLGTAVLPYTLGHLRGGRDFFMTSIDHALWFHSEFRADEWLLYETESPVCGGFVLCIVPLFLFVAVAIFGQLWWHWQLLAAQLAGFMVIDCFELLCYKFLNKQAPPKKTTKKQTNQQNKNKQTQQQQQQKLTRLLTHPPPINIHTCTVMDTLPPPPPPLKKKKKKGHRVKWFENCISDPESCKKNVNICNICIFSLLV